MPAGRVPRPRHREPGPGRSRGPGGRPAGRTATCTAPPRLPRHHPRTQPRHRHRSPGDTLDLHERTGPARAEQCGAADGVPGAAAPRATGPLDIGGRSVTEVVPGAAEGSSSRPFRRRATGGVRPRGRRGRRPVTDTPGSLAGDTAPRRRHLRRIRPRRRRHPPPRPLPTLLGDAARPRAPSGGGHEPRDAGGSRTCRVHRRRLWGPRPGRPRLRGTDVGTSRQVGEDHHGRSGTPRPPGSRRSPALFDRVQPA